MRSPRRRRERRWQVASEDALPTTERFQDKIQQLAAWIIGIAGN